MFYLTASDESPSEESSCLKIPIKEVYSATNSLSPSNFIGQGVAGENRSSINNLIVNGNYFSIHDV